MKKENTIVNKINYQNQVVIESQNKTLKRIRRREPILSRLNKNKGKKL